MNIIPDSMKTVTRILLVAAFALVPIVPESVFADPYSRPYSSPRSSPSYSSPYSSPSRSPSYTSPSLPNYTYKSYSKSYSVGDYSRHTYKYKDSLGNRYKSKTQVLPGGTTVTKGKYRSHPSLSLPDYTYKSHNNSFSVGDYSRHTYKYKDSLGNRHKSKTQVLPSGTTVTKGKYRSPHPSPSLPDYTYKSHSFSVGDYSRHTYKYKDSLGNRHKGTIEVFPGGAVRHKGKVNGRKFKGTSRNK